MQINDPQELKYFEEGKIFRFKTLFQAFKQKDKGKLDKDNRWIQKANLVLHIFSTGGKNVDQLIQVSH